MLRTVTKAGCWIGLATLAIVTEPIRAQEQDTTARDTLPLAVLDPVRVTVTRAHLLRRTQPFAISVVGSDATAARPAIDLDEMLVGVPGLYATNRQNPSQDVRLSIRGFGTRSPFGVRGIRVLLDGIPLTLPDGQGQLTNVNPSTVERIEVLRGTASVLHGNASGGVIAVTSLVGSGGAPPLTGRVSAGSFGTVKAQVTSGRSWQGGGLTASAAYTRSDGFREHAERRRMHGALSVRHEIDGAVLTSHVRLTRDPRAENPGALTSAQLDSARTMADPRNLAANASKTVAQVLAGTSLQGRLGSGTYEVAVYGLRRDLDNPLPFATIQLDRWGWGARASTSVPLLAVPATPLVTAGVDAQWQRDDRFNFAPDGASTTLSQLERVHEIGPFVQVSLYPLRYMTLNGGVRYDRIAFSAADRLQGDGDQSGNRVMASFSGAGGIVVDLAPWAAPYANVSTSFETPTTTELVNRPDGAGGFNPDLDPQHATSVEIGVRGSWPGGRYGVSYFDTRVRGELIPFEVQDGSGRQFFRNAGTGLHRGVEVSATGFIPRGPALSVSYTYADYRFRRFRVDGAVFDGNRLPGIPRHHLYASLRYGVGPGWLAVDVTHASKLFADDANQAPVDAWTRVDLRAALTTGGRRVVVAPFAMISNLFDREYVGSISVNAFGGRFYEPAPRRAFTVGLELSWGR